MIRDNDPKLLEALRQPWTVTVTSEDGEFVARVEEIPDAIAVASDRDSLEHELWDSLRESLRARFEYGDPIPRARRATPVVAKAAQVIALSLTEDFFSAKTGSTAQFYESVLKRA